MKRSMNHKTCGLSWKLLFLPAALSLVACGDIRNATVKAQAARQRACVRLLAVARSASDSLHILSREGGDCAYQLEVDTIP